ncbi:molybdopterin synthase catalytic subunit/molybdopterin synthase sulfur carrier subunit [Lutibacter agarilyticus]|uniref:Molybdopterin synthase sulfur carrier subunit n=1 Tax=Lutibacter agarilyticus TaxID=1109740 RepID=A0A238VSM7_9FLAO|nr:MoaD/ThiS family protein [Lutibacter agarilyticus]SNR37164.1 molybdopterin synthase catalytic subunit/molybdopterin synthase sulfur carrier subunit [Lutibacter agarilyticus]
MKIQLLFFGITTDLVGESSMSYEVPENSSIEALKLKLIAQFASLKNINDFAIAVNESYAKDHQLLLNNDVVAIIPPVSGG